MKCIHCGHSTWTSDREAGRCRVCGEEFAFAFQSKYDPYKLTDERFQRALEEVSAGKTIYFSKSQLRYALDRRLRHSRWSHAWRIPGGAGENLGIFALMFVGSVMLLSWFGPFSLLVVAVAAVGGFFFVRVQSASSTSEVIFSDLNRTVSRWESVHGPIPYLLPDRQAAASAAEKEPDLADYTFTRVLVTDSATMAHMLVANSFHIINNCAVMSVDGYPPGTFKTLLDMLRRNPEQLDVYALHDASVGGCKLPLTLRGEEWFPNPATRITDLGLRPRHVGAMRLPDGTGRARSLLRNLVQWRGGRLANAVVLTGSYNVVPEQLRSILDAEEVAWLEQGKRVELAFMPPERLMNAIGHAFRRKDAELADEAADPVPLMFVLGDAAAREFDSDSDFG